MPLNSDQIFQFRQNLFRDLRNELGHLKTCQTALVVLGITGSGVFLGLISPTDELSNYIPFVLLIPLLILLPLWIIFFDKARTIARIVGFLRVQETLAKQNSETGLIGWESAMKKYWTVRDEYDELNYDDVFESAKESQKDNVKQNKIRESIINSTYWSTVYLLFFLFCIICLGMSFYLMNLNGTIKLMLFFWFLFTLIITYIAVTWKTFHTTFNKMIYYFMNGTSDGEYVHHHRRFYTILLNVWTITIICDIIAIIAISLSHQISMYHVTNFYNIVFANSIITAPFPNDFLYTVIFLIFGSGFISISMIAFWMLSSLIKGYDGRYSYKSFQLRWEIALLEKRYVYSNYVKKTSVKIARADNFGGDMHTDLYKTFRNTYFVSHFTAWAADSETIESVEKNIAMELYDSMQEKLVKSETAFP
jgi:hypothetical protein